MSVEERSSDENLKAFSLFSLHPAKISSQEFREEAKSINPNSNTHYVTILCKVFFND